ncbi:hypothetical protein DH2020_039982 [Rehmannia glutinosa]|uniref:Protein kinase domain-containing protein n=1 Tax=Rehmannia glutinosa TaxID=99300 RepID=A0ABR0UVE8_REHGL
MDPHFSFLIIFSTSLLFTLSAAAAAANDTAALSIFRSQTDLHGALLSNWTTTPAASTACAANWFGIKCTNHRVTAVSLPSLNLRGPIDALASLDQLRLLELRDNRLNGTLAPIANCLNLKHVYLSGNDFSGEIPPELSSLHRLLRLDLSNNNLRGPIPTQLSKLSRLLTLRLENNEISGTIPNFFNSLPNLKDLNLSNNELQGTLQNSLLSRYGGSTFSGNEGLCCNSPNFPNFPKCSNTVPSNPSSLPSSIADPPKKHHKRLSNGAIIALIVSNSLLLLIISSFLLAYYCGNKSNDTNSMAESEFGKRSSYSSEKRVYANNNGGGGDSDGTNGTDKSKLVFFERKKQFELEDLLRASAEMLGKGSLGTVYKAVLEDGSTVAVKRLKDANPCARKEFEQYMDVIGKVRDRNVVRFRAYYYAREEKLLVYDYLPNGSLHSLLHGSRGPGRIPLDWTTRISLILGAARGLAKIHNEYGSSRIPHGNEGTEHPSSPKPRDSHRKPMSTASSSAAQVLTGRAPSGHPPTAHQEEPAVDLPKWVSSVVRDEWTAEVFDQELLRYKNIEEELVSMLHVAMACVVARPEKRPTMVEVVRMIEEIRVEQSPVGEEYDESRSSLSPSLATTEDA